MRSRWTIAFLLLLAMGAGCRQDMHDQPRYEPLEASTFFADGRSARPSIPDTVARGALPADPRFETGKVDGKPVDTLPLPRTKELLLRGRERFEIFCSPCHDRAGTGAGMVV
ncbi:MAG: cytochrome c, partial [Deltaproteobacteria bacterium]